MPRREKRRFEFTTGDDRPGIVREARPSDAKRCLQITLEVSKERPRTLAVTEGEIWGVRGWRDHRLPWSPAGVTLVAEIADTVVGSLTVMRGTRRAIEHTAEFGIYVSPEARGLGLARAMLEVAEIWAKEHGVERMVLSVFATNTRAKALYEACGYAAEGYEKGGMKLPEGRVDVIRMAKEL